MYSQSVFLIIDDSNNNIGYFFVLFLLRAHSPFIKKNVVNTELLNQLIKGSVYDTK